MEEIKVGEYVRTEHGNIFKVSKTTDFGVNNVFPHDENGIMIVTQITKYSPNIIDLIEEGDYINGCEVTQVTSTQLIVRDENGLSMWKKKDVEKHIKHIVTHEQYNSIKYVIGE